MTKRLDINVYGNLLLCMLDNEISTYGRILHEYLGMRYASRLWIKFYLLVKSSQSQAKFDLNMPLMLFVQQLRF